MLQQLRVEEADYRNYVGMDVAVYQNLLSMVSPLIQKSDTVMRLPISLHESLSATLSFLVSEQSYECLNFLTIISPQALGYYRYYSSDV